MSRITSNKIEKDIKWHERYNELKKFLIANNDRYPSYKSNSQKETSLAHWISYQRRCYNLGILDQDKIDNLNLIDFIWDQASIQWQNNLIDLKEFIATNKKFPAVSSNNKQERELALWLSLQRSELNSNNLSKFQIESLMNVGVFSNPLDSQWQLNLTKLVEFIEINRRYPQLKSNNCNEKSIAIWVNAQRRMIRIGKITKERLQKLNDIGFIAEQEKEM